MRRSGLIFLCFLLLSAITLSPLLFHMQTRVPGLTHGEANWDYYHFHWNLWWMQHAVQNGENIWYTDYVLAPFHHNLSYHSLTAALLPVYLIFEPLIGHMRTANGIVWISLALTGSLMYAYLRRQSISRPLALIGGIALAFSPYMLDHARSGHLNLITVFWLPILLLAWEKLLRTYSALWAILTGIVLWGMWFTDTLIVFWGGLLLGPYAIWALIQARRRVLLVLLGLLSLGVTLALAWLLGPLQPTLDFDTSQLAPARLLTLRSYALPLKALFFQPGGDDRSLGILLVVLVWLAVVLPNKDRQRWFWLVAALPALLLTLGPDVQIAGVRIPMPFRLIHDVFNGQMRTPIRFLPPALFALIVFAARSFDARVRRIKRPAARQLVTAAAALAFLVDYGAFQPFTTLPKLPDYEFYAMLRGEQYDSYDYVVIEVPSGPYTGWDALGTYPEAMFYGITHEKRMVSGLLSRTEQEQRLYYQKSPLFGWLTGYRVLDMQAALSELNQIVDQWPVGYIVVHQDWMTPEQAQEVFAAFNGHPDLPYFPKLCYITTERDAVLYRTTSHPKGCPPLIPPESAPGVYTIPFGESGDEGYMGAGWYRKESFGGSAGRWAGGQTESLLYASLPTGSDYTITLRVMAPFEGHPRAITVVANGALLGVFTVQPNTWSEPTLTIPAAVIAKFNGDLVFSLSADGMIAAADLGISADTRPLTIGYDWVRFERAEAR